MRRLILTTAAVFALAAAGYDFVAGHLACSLDTSYCAKGHEKDGLNVGLLPDAGRRGAGAKFKVYFESRRGLPPVSFMADAAGRFCIVWPQERVFPSGVIDGQTFSISDWRALHGASPPAGCELGDVGVPSNRADDLRSRWQYWSVLVLCAVSQLVVAAVKVLPPSRQSVAMTIGISIALAAVVLNVAVWT